MARLDPDGMEQLGASIGDVVQITGHSTTALKVMPVYPDERGKNLIQIDGIARENAGAGLDERVHVEPQPIRDARVVNLAPIGQSWLRQQARDASYVGRLVDGLVVQAGERVRVNLFGSRRRTSPSPVRSPSGLVLIQAGTRIQIAGQEDGRAPRPEGLLRGHRRPGPEITRIREMIELPLRYPGGLRAAGDRPARGRPALRPAGLRQDAHRPGGRQRDRGPLHPRQRAGDHPQVLRGERGPPAQDLRGGRGARRPASSSSTRSTPSRPSGTRWRARSRSAWSPSCWR